MLVEPHRLSLRSQAASGRAWPRHRLFWGQKCVPHLRGPQAASFTPLPCRVAHRIDRVCPNGPGQPGPTTLQRRARRFHIALSVLLLLLLLLLCSFFPLLCQGDTYNARTVFPNGTGRPESLAHRIDRVCTARVYRGRRPSTEAARSPVQCKKSK